MASVSEIQSSHEGSPKVVSSPSRPAGRTKVFVGNLPDNATEKDVYDICSLYGKVTAVYMKKGYAFVAYQNADSANDAVNRLNLSMLKGRKINVNYARVQDISPSSPRYRRGSRSPPRGRSHSPSRQYRSWSPRNRPARSLSRSPSRSVSRTPVRSRSPSPTTNNRSPSPSGVKRRSVSPYRPYSPSNKRIKSGSASPSRADISANGTEVNGSLPEESSTYTGPEIVDNSTRGPISFQLKGFGRKPVVPPANLKMDTPVDEAVLPPRHASPRPRDNRDNRDIRDTRDNSRDTRDARDSRDSKDIRDNRDARSSPLPRRSPTRRDNREPFPRRRFSPRRDFRSSQRNTCKCLDPDIFFRRLEEFEEARKRQLTYTIEELSNKLEERDKKNFALISKLVARDESKEAPASSLQTDIAAVKNELKNYVKDAASKAQQYELQLHEEQHKYQMLNFQYQHELQNKSHPQSSVSGQSIKSDPQTAEFLRNINATLALMDERLNRIPSDIQQKLVSSDEATAKQMDNLITEVTTSKEARWKRIEGLTTKVFNLEEKFEAFQLLLKKGTDEIQSVNNDITSQIQTLLEIMSDGGKSSAATRAKRQKKT